MVTRNSRRARSTAEKMRRYKEAADASRVLDTNPQLRTRSSPRNKIARPSSTGVRGSRQNSPSNSDTQYQSGSSCTRDNEEKSDAARDMVETPETPPRGSWINGKNDVRGKKGVQKVSVLEGLAAVPETPPRGSASSGRKRIFAPAVGYGVIPDCIPENGESPPQEYQKPSKKRRTFQTPPVSTERDTAIVDSTFVHDSGGSSYLSGDRICEKERPKQRIPNLPERLQRDDAYEDLEPPLPVEKSGERITFDPSIRETSAKHPRSRKHFPNDNGVLDAINTSSVTLSRFFDSVRRDLMKALDERHQKQTAALQKVASDLASSVTAEVRNIQGIIQMLSTNSLKEASTGRSTNKTSLTEWEKKLDDLTPNLKLIFSTEVIGRILAYNIPLQLEEIFSSERGDAKKASEAVQTILFSLQPGEKKYLYAEGIGREHSRFKFTVVQNTFFNVCKNSFGHFSSSHCRGSAEEVPTPRDSSGISGRYNSRSDSVDVNVVSTDKSCCILRPNWLQPGYVTVDHIQVARTFLETSKQSRKSKIRDTPNSNDIASHGALRVYRQVGAHLHQARENVRATFFQGIGYVMVPWDVHVTDISQASLKVRFLHDDIEGSNKLNLGAIPDTIVCTLNANSEERNLADTTNKQLLFDFFRKWQNMTVAVQHDVYVLNCSGGQRRHSGGERRTIHRLIHLVDIACDVCVEYCRVGTREIFLRTNNSALRSTMIVALLLKALILEYLEMCEAISGTTIPDPKLVQVHGTCLKDMIPGSNTQKSMLQSRCLRMTKKEFEMFNHPPDRSEAGNGYVDSGAGGRQGAEIQETAARGIVSI